MPNSDTYDASLFKPPGILDFVILMSTPSLRASVEIIAYEYVRTMSNIPLNNGVVGIRLKDEFYRSTFDAVGTKRCAFCLTRCIHFRNNVLSVRSFVLGNSSLHRISTG